MKRIIIIGLIIFIKLVLMGLFSSDYQNNMFIPFVNNFLEGNNPYDFYYEKELISSFPYFPLMLLVEAMGGLLLKGFSSSSVFMQNLIFKIPLFVFDLIGYHFICKMNVRFKYATVFYFCSPIIIYATYMHGQLDIIPTTLLIISIYYLLNWKNKNNLFWCALFLGLSLSTKFHILAAVPILLCYVVKKKDSRYAIKGSIIMAGTVIIITSVFWGEGFIRNVLFNEEQMVLFAINLDYGTTRILIPVAVLVIIYLNVYELNYFNRNLLISVIGLVFSIFLICVPPMPAWFIWIVPFVTLYFSLVNEEKYRIMIVYSAFNLIYVFYFICLHQTAYTDLYLLGKSLQILKMNNVELKNLVFTLMTACFAVVIYKVYRFGIASNGLYKRRNIPFTIGIAGDSGAGKSKLLEKIENLFGTGKDILFIEGDGDHRWERNNENWEKYTALDPKANFLYRQAEDIRVLRSGSYVERSEYDHDLGVFTDLKRIKPKKYIILCGLHSLYLPQLRKELDLRIFMDTEQELRKFWKIQRDTRQRGYSKEKIVEQIEKRVPDALKYIYPQRKYADLVITYFDMTLKDCYQTNHTVQLSVKLSMDINMDLENVIRDFHSYGVYPEQILGDDFNYQEVIFDGVQLQGKDIDFEQIAERNIPQYEDFFTYAPIWETGVEGVIQVFLLIYISRKMKE